MKWPSRKGRKEKPQEERRGNNTKILNFKFFFGIFILFLTSIYIVSAVVDIGEEETEIEGVKIIQPRTTPFSNESFNQTLVTDLITSLAWLKDGTNAPPTANWNMGSYGFNNVGGTNFTSGQVTINSTSQIPFKILGNDFNGENTQLVWLMTGFSPSSFYLNNTKLIVQGADSQEVFAVNPGSESSVIYNTDEVQYNSEVQLANGYNFIINDAQARFFSDELRGNVNFTFPEQAGFNIYSTSPQFDTLEVNTLRLTNTTAEFFGQSDHNGFLTVGGDIKGWGNLNITDAFFANPTGSKHSRFGQESSVLLVSDDADTLVTVKVDSTAVATTRALAAISEYNGTMNKANGLFGLNSFVYGLSNGGNITSATPGAVGGRYAFRDRGQNTFNTQAGGVASRTAIQSLANTAWIGTGFAYLAEGQVVSDATSIINTSINFWGEDTGSETGTIHNNWGFFQEEFTGETNPIEFGVSGSGMYAMRVSRDVIPTEFMESTDVGHVDFYATTSVDVNAPLLNLTGNFTGNQFHADGWGHDIGDIVIGTAGVYFNVTNMTIGDLNGFTFDGENFTVLKSGLYDVRSTWSFSGTANNEYHISISVNGVQQNRCHGERVIGTGGDVGFAGFACRYRLSINDVVKVVIENVDASNDATIHDISLTFLRIND